MEFNGMKYIPFFFALSSEKDPETAHSAAQPASSTGQKNSAAYSPLLASKASALSEKDTEESPLKNTENS